MFLEYIGMNWKVPHSKQNNTATAILPESTSHKTTNTEQGEGDSHHD